MRIRLDLQWRVLVLMIGGMGIILILSAYFHALVTRLLIEDDRYDTALSQTAALATRIVSEQLLQHPSDLEEDISLLRTARPDFRQIDVYEQEPSGPALVASSSRSSPRVPILDDNTRDNDLGEMEHPAKGVVTMEVIRGGERHWVMTIAMRGPGRTAYVSALVRKASDSPLVEALGVRRDMVLASAIVVSAGLSYIVFISLFRHPARDIVDAMRAARAGDFDARAEVRRNDELGDIARGFNALMDDLTARDREREQLVGRIRGFNDELQREVTRATAELRAVNDELFHAQQRLARSERLAAMGQVAASLAHEIGTPLNSINGHVQLLARRLPDDREAQRRLGIITESLQTIVTSVRTLLWRAGRRRPAVRRVDLSTVISNTLRLVGPTLETHGITAAVDLSAAVPVMADPERLEQVLLNLINNSVDAMNAGGRLEIFARVPATEGGVELFVRDNGPGVSAEMIGHLFEEAWTTKATGSGFGLASSRAMMQEIGGELAYVPGDGGACFVVRLAAAPEVREEDRRAVIG